MKVDYGAGEKEVKISAYTLVLYEQEFGGRDLIADFFSGAEKKVGYSTIQWTVALKVLWAALKTADDTLPPFKHWSKSIDDVDLLQVAVDLRGECQRRFFRTGASASA